MPCLPATNNRLLLRSCGAHATCRSIRVHGLMRRLAKRADLCSHSWIRKRMPPRRGEVWLFDLGMTAKTRPVVVVSVEYGDADRAIVTVVPHTTEIRQSPFAVQIKVPFLDR